MSAKMKTSPTQLSLAHLRKTCDQLDECIQYFKLNAKTHLTFAKETEKILKGEL